MEGPVGSDDSKRKPRGPSSAFLEEGDEMDDTPQSIAVEQAKGLIRSGTFWPIVPVAVEWKFMLQGVVEDFIRPDAGPQDLLVMYPFENSRQPLVLLSRKKVPAVALSERFGMDFTRFKKGTLIYLDSPEEELFQPTVDYWGEA